MPKLKTEGSTIKEGSTHDASISSLHSETGRPDHIENHLVDFGKPWYRVRGLFVLNLWIGFITIACVACGYDGSLLNGLQAIEQWSVYFNNPTGIRLGVLATGFSFGTVLVSFRVADILSDKFGRRAAIGIGQSFAVIGAAIQGSSINYGMFFIARFISGTSYIAPIAAPMLMSEIAPANPKHRGPATAAHNLSWYLGAMISSCITYATFLHMSSTDNRAWRIPSYLQGIFPLINICFIPWMPESPRWLISKGRHQEARDFLIKYHANGDEELGRDLVEFEMKEIENAIMFERISKTTSMSTFFKTKTNFHRLFIACFLGFMMNFSGNGLLSYYLPKVLNSIGITNRKRQLELNIYLTFYNYATSIISAAVCGKLKRRFMYLASTITMCVCFIIWTVLSAINQKTGFKNKALGNGVLAMIFLFNAGYNFAIMVMAPVYTSELMPYSLRTKGYAAMSLVANLGNVFNGLVNPIAMDAIEWKYYIVYCCTLAFEVVVVYLTFVETYGYTLEEVSEFVFKEDVTKTVEAENRNKLEKAQCEV